MKKVITALALALSLAACSSGGLGGAKALVGSGPGTTAEVALRNGGKEGTLVVRNGAGVTIHSAEVSVAEREGQIEVRGTSLYFKLSPNTSGYFCSLCSTNRPSLPAVWSLKE